MEYILIRGLVVCILRVYCISVRGLVAAILVYKVMMQHGICALEDVADDETHREEVLRADIITLLPLLPRYRNSQ